MLLPTERRSASSDSLCGLLDGFDVWHLAKGGVVLEFFTNPTIPSAAVLIGLVLATAEQPDRFSNSTGHRASGDSVVEAGHHGRCR